MDRQKSQAEQAAYFDSLASRLPATDIEEFISPGYLARREWGAFLRAARFEPGSRILEVGAGTGAYSIPMLQEGLQVVASDISQEALRVLQVRAAKLGVSDTLQADFIVGAEDL